MSIFQSLRDIHPYRLLLIATLAAIVLVQAAAMVLVTRSQVRKAEAHYAAERAASAVAPAGEPTAVSARPEPGGVVNVGYVAAR